MSKAKTSQVTNLEPSAEATVRPPLTTYGGGLPVEFIREESKGRAMNEELMMSATSYRITVEDKERLAHLAGGLGFVQTRGAGAGRLPNVTAFLRLLALRAGENEEGVMEALRSVGVTAE